MNKLNISIVLVLILVNVLSAQRIEMEVGQQRTISIPGIRGEVGVTGPIQVVERAPGELIIIAKAAGYGTITADTPQGTQIIEVVVYATQKVKEELTELLKDIEGVKIRTAGNKVIVEGKLMSDTDRIIFNKIIELYPDVINMVTSADLPIEIFGTIVEVESKDITSINLLENNGIRGEATLSGEITGPGATTSLSWSASTSITDVLSTLIESQKAKVVAKTRVVTISGKKATILSGGEIPYQTIGTAGVGVEWKKYGLKLEVTPERKQGGEIFMDMHVESSEPTTTTFGPSLISRSADIQVSVENKKSVIIGGLFNTITSSSTKAGCLIPRFGSSSQKIDKEILIMVTPYAPSTLDYDDFKQIKREDTK